MATYYRWRQSSAIVSDNITQTESISRVFAHGDTKYVNVWALTELPEIISLGRAPFYKFTNNDFLDYIEILDNEIFSQKTIPIQNGQYFLVIIFSVQDSDLKYSDIYYLNRTGKTIYITTKGSESETDVKVQFSFDEAGNNTTSVEKSTISGSRGDFIDYVYSTSPNTYQNGLSEDLTYWYDQRTTITSPTAPTNLQYPNPITTPTVTVSWDAATSNVPQYPIDHYVVGFNYHNDPFTVVEKTVSANNTSAELTIPMTYNGNIVDWVTPLVYVYDTNGKSNGVYGSRVDVYFSPTITVPSLAMQEQQITVTWTAVDGATGYTLQRKANTDADWVEVYTGQALEFTEEVGTWSTVQYRVQATFSSGPGGWGTSKVVPVVSASALVISGQDGDLGTLTADVPYTVSTDTGKPITVERKVNGQVVASIEASSNFAYDIPIYDLPTGAGTIILTCSVTPEGQAPVQAERKWTYYKAPVLFPQTGSTAQITKEGKNVYPLTIAEAVRTPQYMGGSLDKTLELLEEILNTAVISVGTYVGTGTSGQSAPNRLRFMSPPTVVTVYGEGRVLSISNTEPTGGQADAYIQGNEAIWYNISADKQLNESGKTYTYFAAGKRV